MNVQIPKVTLKDAASYALLPGVVPRLGEFIPRFWMFAYLMAVIFESLGLLPRGHSLLNADKMEDCSVRKVLGAAAHNLGGGFRNSDRYIIFAVFVIGIVLLSLQFFAIFMLIVSQSAEAAGFTFNFTSMFVTPDPRTDVGFLMMDRVFGIPKFFGSCYDPTAPGVGGAICKRFIPLATFPSTGQKAMQALFSFYSMGMLIVAGFVIVYYLFAMLVETVGTGVPFGKRFQSFYTPMRVILAVLLMTPLAYGYNTGQYVVLWAAKYGSSFGTNAWFLYNQRVGNNPLGLDMKQLVAQPVVPDIESLINFFYLVHTCKAAYEFTYDGADGTTAVAIKPYLVREGTSVVAAEKMEVATGTTFTDAKAFMRQQDVYIVFGDYNTRYKAYPANVKPVCGAITVPAHSKLVEGVDKLYNVFFAMVMNLWIYPDIDKVYGKRMMCNLRFSGVHLTECDNVPNSVIAWDADAKAPAGQGFYMNVRLDRQAYFSSQLLTEITTLRTTSNPEVLMNQEVLNFGWGGAGFWFNKLVSFNGAMTDAVMNLPAPTKYPLIMEVVEQKKKQFEKSTDSKERYTTNTASGGKNIPLDKLLTDADVDNAATEIEIAKLLGDVYKIVQNSQATAKPKTANSENPVKNWVALLFGQSGIFDFRNNNEVFPLAKLAMFGREIINKTVIMIAAGGLMTGLGGVVAGQAGPVGELIGLVGSTMMTFATMGVAVGVMLYYVIPFLPFMYFFMAVGRWVKGVFEAMIGVPLWALAHLRLGGDGIPGSAAIVGYSLILEIFLRPILTLFGLLASLATFMAITTVLDSTFDIVVKNVGGFDMTTLSSGGTDSFAGSARDGLDALFYTVIYAVIVYMIAISSFKLIDIFPNTVIRYLGTSAKGFSDGVGDIKGQVDMYLYNNVQSFADNVRKKVSGISDAAATSFRDVQNTKNQLGGRY